MALDFKPQRAALYTRISKDEDGEGLGVERQRVECLEWAEKNGWEIAETYTDNDVSAYSGKVRQNYRRMLADVESGARDGILVLTSSRLTRTPRELEDILDLYDRTGVVLGTVSGMLDLGTDEGQTMARMFSAMNHQYSSGNAKALRRKHKELMEAGKVSGRQRVYGYDVVTVEDSTAKGWHTERVINEGEAEVLKRVTAKIIEDGEQFNMTQMCRTLNAEGLRTVDGKEFRVQSMRKFVTAWRIAGIRDHNDEPITKGVWKPIITEEDLRSVRSILDSPERKTYTGAPRKYLLSNLLSCGKCGGVMQYGSSTKKATETHAKACWESYRCKSCSQSISMEVTDEQVIKAIGRMLADPSPVMRAFIDAEPAVVKDLRAKRAEAHEEVKAVHLMDLRATSKGALIQPLEKELDEIDAQISQHLHRDALRSLIATLTPLENVEDRGGPFDLDKPSEGVITQALTNREAVREAFKAMDLVQRRAVVTALMRVTIAQSKGMKRSDVIARIVITELDPATGEPQEHTYQDDSEFDHFDDPGPTG